MYKTKKASVTLNDKPQNLSDDKLKDVSGGSKYDMDRYSYWYEQVNTIMRSGLSRSEIEDKLRGLAEEIEKDSLFEPTDKSFLLEQIKSLIV